MNLQQYQKQRIKLYKNQLKKEIERSTKAKKQQKSYELAKLNVDINQLTSSLNQNQIQRVQKRKIMNKVLQDDNAKLSNLRKNISFENSSYVSTSGATNNSSLRQKGSNMQIQNEQGLENKSFIDDINTHDIERVNKNKETYARFTHDNEKQDQIKKYQYNKSKSMQKQQQQKHVHTVKQMELQSLKNYNEIKKKHVQNMKIYDFHSQLIQQNTNYKKQIQRFTQCQEDIISRLKRNQSRERKNRMKQNQQVLRNQIDEYQQRQMREKSHVLQGHKLEDSIFKNLLHATPKNMRQYAQQLKMQISEKQKLKQVQRQLNKQKYKISSIFGGQQGKQRLIQLQMIDRKLGLGHPQNQQKIMLHGNQISQVRNFKLPQQRQQTVKQAQTPRYSMLGGGSNKLNHTNDQIGSRHEYEDAKKMSYESDRYYDNQVNKQAKTTNKGKQQSYDNQKMIEKQLEINPNRRLYGSYDLVTGANKFYS